MRDEQRHRGEYTKRKLGPKAMQAYRFIAEYIHFNVYSPPQSAIAKYLGIANSGANRYVHLLIDEGFLKRETRGKMNVKLTDKRPEWYV